MKKKWIIIGVVVLILIIGYFSLPKKEYKGVIEDLKAPKAVVTEGDILKQGDVDDSLNTEECLSSGEIKNANNECCPGLIELERDGEIFCDEGGK